MVNYRKAYEWGKTRLEVADVPEEALNARLLLEHVCGTRHNDLYVNSERKLTGDEEREYENLIRLRAQRVPLQHLTGHQEFMGLDFIVNRDVLIPRQDTEILVEEALIAVSDSDRVLDLCTGSGCVLLSLMCYKNNIIGVGSDISVAALKVAKENYERLSDRINGKASFIQSDVYENINGMFDVILANPPYIKSSDIEQLMPEVRDHDPILALDGGEDGLDIYRRIIEGCDTHLENEGKLIMEIGFDQAQDVMDILEKNYFDDIRIIKDLAGLDRVVYARKER